MLGVPGVRFPVPVHGQIQNMRYFNSFSHGVFRVRRLIAVGHMRQPCKDDQGENEDNSNVQMFVRSPARTSPNKLIQTERRRWQSMFFAETSPVDVQFYFLKEGQNP